MRSTSPGRAPRRSFLPIDAAPERREGGYEIRLPVRAEHVTFEKRSVVRSEAVVHNRRTTETRRIAETLGREVARVDRRGDLEVTPAVDRDAARRQTGWGR